jgi:hypothetical protein
MKKIVVFFGIVLVLGLIGCPGDPTDAIALADGVSINYTGDHNTGTFIGTATTLTVTNEVPCNLYSIVVSPAGGPTPYGDLLGNNVIGINRTNMIVGVPSETLDIEIEFSKTVGDPAFPSISIPGHNFNPTPPQKDWTLSLNVGQTLLGVGPVDPNATILVIDGITVIIK